MALGLVASMSGAATTIADLHANSREWDTIIP